jgi:phosphoadenosine phosphosulfate reductase
MFESNSSSTAIDPAALVSDIVLDSAKLARDDIARARILSDAMIGLSPAERIEYLRRALDGPVVFTHGFGVEGQLLFHWICESNIDIDVVALDTGRLFSETYELWEQTERHYGRRIRAIYPHHAAVETLVAKQGINGFYESKQARFNCCDVRKTRPLDHALEGAAAWIAGLRADQNSNRRNGGLASYDSARRLIKLNPLYDWTRGAVLAAVKANDVPINSLHAKGFASIGCAPCTRAIAPDEPERNGRWWWEQDGSRECGLHLPKKGRKTAAEPRPLAEHLSDGCG